MGQSYRRIRSPGGILVYACLVVRSARTNIT
jgi:hypothetical protein